MTDTTTAAITEALATEAATIHRQVGRLVGSITEGFMLLGELLADVQDRKLWAVLGAESFEDWCSAPDINLSVGTAYRLIRVQRLRISTSGNGLITDSELVVMGYTKADDIGHALRTAGSEEERQKLIGAAIGNGRTDLRKELAAAEGMDVDAAWRSPLAYYVRETRRGLTRLELAADPDAAAAILDTLTAHGMAAMAALKREAKG